MERDLGTRKRKKSIEDAIRNVKKSNRNGSGMCCVLAIILIQYVPTVC